MVVSHALKVCAEFTSEPSLDIAPAPKPIPSPRVRDRRREVPGAAHTSDKQSYAFPSPPRAGSDAGDRDEPDAGHADDLYAVCSLDVGHGGENGVTQARRLAIEVDELGVVHAADQTVIASGFEEAFYHRLVLQIRAIDNQGEVMSGHLPFFYWLLLAMPVEAALDQSPQLLRVVTDCGASTRSMLGSPPDLLDRNA